jgi:hypothetical protein
MRRQMRMGTDYHSDAGNEGDGADHDPRKEHTRAAGQVRRETGFDRSISYYIVWYQNIANTPYSGVLFSYALLVSITFYEQICFSD